MRGTFQAYCASRSGAALHYAARSHGRATQLNRCSWQQHKVRDKDPAIPPRGRDVQVFVLLDRAVTDTFVFFGASYNKSCSVRGWQTVVKMSAVCSQDRLGAHNGLRTIYKYQWCRCIKISLWILVVSKSRALKVDAETFSCIFYLNLFSTFLCMTS